MVIWFGRIEWIHSDEGMAHLADEFLEGSFRFRVLCYVP